MLFRPSRRQIISGMTALGALAGTRTAFAQAPKRIPIPEGEFVPLPIAIPNFVAGTPQDAEVGAVVSIAAGNAENQTSEHALPAIDCIGRGNREVHARLNIVFHFKYLSMC